MQQPRFVFLALPIQSVRDGAPSVGLMWTLMSPNNRSLGRSGDLHDTYGTCREAVLRLRERWADAEAAISTADATGQWVWSITLDGEVVARSCRSYLRVRECNYNLERFSDALPAAEIVVGSRNVRRGLATAGDAFAGSAWTPP